MIGITGYGGYIPYNRLQRSEIQKEFGTAGLKGERTIAGYDEDSATMAVAAALNATHNQYGVPLKAVYFATTTSPYAEKQSETLIAGALDLPETVRTAEFTSTLRAGTTALRAGLDTAMAGGNAGPQSGYVLVTAADMRSGGASGANEAMFGDGAAAIILGSDKVLAKFVGAASVALEIVDTWRNQGDSNVRNWDERFQMTEGYGRAIPDVLKAVFAETGLKAEDIAKVIFPVPPKAQAILGKAGFKPEQVSDSMTAGVGLTGAAHPLLMLAAELEKANPGDKLLVLGYGEGADALIFEATDAIKEFKPLRSIPTQLESKRNDITYATYLKWRQRVDMEPARRPDPSRPSSPFMHRRAKFNLALYGTKCTKCGTPQFPAQRVCYKCRARDEMENYGFRDKRGKLTTYSADYLSISLSPPEIAAVVDFEGGGRMMCNMTDVDAEALQIGQPVEMTLRKMFTAGGIHSYFWKATGIR